MNKTSEYGVLALRFISDREGTPLSAREISEGLNLPFEITAKTLQRLKEAGFITSIFGANGGYKLLNPLNKISFAQVIDVLEGPVAIVECTQHSGNECSLTPHCELKGTMKILNEKIRNILETTRLDEVGVAEKKSS